MPQRRAHFGSYAVVDTCIKPLVLNPRKNARRVVGSADNVAFGSARERFHESDYYLEDGDPGGNRMFAPHVGRSAIRETQLHSDVVAHGVVGEKSTVKGWSHPQDGIKGARGWCGGAYHSSFAPDDTNPLRDKHANLMGMAGNESRLQELQKLRNEKLMQMPGPGSYHVETSRSPRSFRRPESGGPKDRARDGKTLREVEMSLFDRHQAPFRSYALGPGYYRPEVAKDRTQSRRMAQPVTAAFKPAHSTRAECLSVTLLTGHHWRERVPRLGSEEHRRQSDARDDVGKAWPGMEAEASKEEQNELRHSPEYRKLQADLDSRLSKPKVASHAPGLLVSRVAAPKAFMRHERLSTSIADRSWVDSRAGSPDAAAQNIGSWASHDRRAEGVPVQYGLNREELPPRAPSAPPQDLMLRDSLDAAKYSSLRPEKSDGPASFRGVPPNQKEILRDYMLTAEEGRGKMSEARRAAERAVLYEQRRMNWQLRSTDSPAQLQQQSPTKPQMHV